MIYRNGCWICGGEADSREHKTKRSELIRIFPPTKNKQRAISERPWKLSFEDEGVAFSQIKSPDSNGEKYSYLICKDCNSDRTQPLDLAYDKFSTWCWENPTSERMNLNDIWGADYVKELSYFYGYCIKILGCEILNSKALLPKDFQNPLDFKLKGSNFFISVCKSSSTSIIHPMFIRESDHSTLGKGSLLTHIVASDLEESGVKNIVDLIWYRQIGNYQINFWHNIAPNPSLGPILGESTSIYNIPDLNIDCFDMDYVRNASIYGEKKYVEYLKTQQEHLYKQYKLGVLYAKGAGVPKDCAEATRLLKLSADRGYSIAQNDLGHMYANGICVPENYSEAIRYFNLSADQCNVSAEYNLGFMYDRAKNYTEAERYYRLAAEHGQAMAQNRLGIMYASGLGIEKDDAEAVRWWTLSANQGHIPAQQNLAKMLNSQP